MNAFTPNAPLASGIPAGAKLVDIELPASGTAPSTPVYAILPPGATRGVVVIHEILGHQPEIERVVKNFAYKGYAAVMPNLFSHGSRMSCIRRAMQEIQRGKGDNIDQILLTRSWLSKQTGIPFDKIGIIGFCIGGGFALAAGRGWGAVSTNYGDLPPDEVLRGIGPVIGCYGGQDRIFGKNGPKLEAKLQRIGAKVETHTYPDAAHSFLTDGHHPLLTTLTRPMMKVAYHPEAAADAWQKIFSFFDQELA